MKKTFLILAATLVWSSLDVQAIDPKLATYVLCGKRGESIRFEKSPTLSIIGEFGANRAIIAEAVEGINETLKGLPVQIKLIEDGNEKADIVVRGSRANGDGNGVTVGAKLKIQNKAITRAEVWYPIYSEEGFTNPAIAPYLLLWSLGFPEDREERTRLDHDSFWVIPFPEQPTETDKRLIRLKYELPTGTSKTRVQQEAQARR